MPHHLLLSHCLVLQYFLIIYNPRTHTRLFSLHHPGSLPFSILSCFEMPYPNLGTSAWHYDICTVCLIFCNLRSIPLKICFTRLSYICNYHSVGSSADTVPTGTFTSKLTPMHAASAKPANLFVLLIFFPPLLLSIYMLSPCPAYNN